MISSIFQRHFLIASILKASSYRKCLANQLYRQGRHVSQELRCPCGHRSDWAAMENQTSTNSIKSSRKFNPNFHRDWVPGSLDFLWPACLTDARRGILTIDWRAYLAYKTDMPDISCMTIDEAFRTDKIRKCRRKMEQIIFTCAN